MQWARVDQSVAFACRRVRMAILVGALLVCWPAIARDDSKISDADANASAEASGRTIYTHYEKKGSGSFLKKGSGSFFSRRRPRPPA